MIFYAIQLCEMDGGPTVPQTVPYVILRVSFTMKEV